MLYVTNICDRANMMGGGEVLGANMLGGGEVPSTGKWTSDQP